MTCRSNICYPGVKLLLARIGNNYDQVDCCFRSHYGSFYFWSSSKLILPKYMKILQQIYPKFVEMDVWKCDFCLPFPESIKCCKTLKYANKGINDPSKWKVVYMFVELTWSIVLFQLQWSKEWKHKREYFFP